MPHWPLSLPLNEPLTECPNIYFMKIKKPNKWKSEVVVRFWFGHFSSESLWSDAFDTVAKSCNYNFQGNHVTHIGIV